MGAKRRKRIIDVFDTAFGGLAQSAPAAFRVKYRKMAADPFAFYRGSACLFYADVTDRADEWVDDRSGRIWIHGDLHPENFGTYLNATGRLVFDVNDYDEAYLGHYTWDLMRFCAGMALMGWQKALPEKDVRDLIGRYLRAYLAQVNHYLDSENDDDFSVNLANTSGPVLEVLREARVASRLDLLDSLTLIDDGVRRFQHDHTVRHLGKAERRKVERAFAKYLETIPPAKRYDRSLFYEVRDVVGKSGFGIGSAGLPAYSILVEGYSQSLDNDVVLSMKQANVPALSYFAGNPAISGYFDHEGHRTVVSQRSLQVHTDPLLGYTDIDGVGYVVSEVSPYELDLDWDEINEPSEMAAVVDVLGQATAKIHCASDVDSDQDLVDFQTEEAIAGVLDGRRRAFVAALTDFGVEYAAQVRADHADFVEAFRAGQIGVPAT
ncbi:MAG TPA: DUF2252 domain-containing protein [Jatrophihabitans sp.]|nr:DUF2252 domain-containing protein [Jatrophihabitans sp.]